VDSGELRGRGYGGAGRRGGRVGDGGGAAGGGGGDPAADIDACAVVRARPPPPPPQTLLRPRGQRLPTYRYDAPAAPPISSAFLNPPCSSSFEMLARDFLNKKEKDSEAMGWGGRMILFLMLRFASLNS
jgi:hypothetical protein